MLFVGSMEKKEGKPSPQRSEHGAGHGALMCNMHVPKWGLEPHPLACYLSGVWYPARGPRTMHVRTTPDNPSPATAIHIAKLHNIMFACLCSMLNHDDVFVTNVTLVLQLIRVGGPIPGVRNPKPTERGRVTKCGSGSHGTDDLNHKNAIGIHACRLPRFGLQ